MKTTIKTNMITIFSLTFVCLLAYYLLLQDNFLDMSISAIIAKSNHLELKKHLMVLGFLPVYIATIIFGTAMLGIYIGSALQQYLIRQSKRIN
jgi:hypothetical protein